MQGARKSPAQQGRDREHFGWGALIKNAIAAQWGRATVRVLKRRSAVSGQHPVGGNAPQDWRAGGVERSTLPAPRSTSEGTADPNAERRTPNPTSESDAPEQTAIRAAIARAWPVTKTAFKEFGDDNGTLMAAAVAFYLVLSLVPLVLVALAIFGYVMGDGHAFKEVMRFVSEFFPAQRQMLEGVITKVRESRGTLGTVGLASLMLTATGGFATLETAISVQWRAKSRNFIWNKVFAFLMMLVIGGLMVLSLGITWVIQWAGKIPGLQWLQYNLVAQVLGYVLPVLISGLMFTSVYKLFPNTKVEWKPALAAGFVIAVLWEAFKLGYTRYNAQFHQSQSQARTYGDELGAFVGLIVWIYYTCALILFGSELAWVLQGCPAGSKPAPKEMSKAEG